MKLHPVDRAQAGLVAGWLASPAVVMTQRDIHMLRVFTTDPSDEPIGLVAVSDIDRTVGTGRLWYVLGEQEHTARGYTSRAVAQLLEQAFAALGLQAVNAWVVECNALTGRLRRSHLIDGRSYDRLLFDRLAEEFRADGNRR